MAHENASRHVGLARTLPFAGDGRPRATAIPSPARKVLETGIISGGTSYTIPYSTNRSDSET